MPHVITPETSASNPRFQGDRVPARSQRPNQDEHSPASAESEIRECAAQPRVQLVLGSRMLDECRSVSTAAQL